VAQIIKQLTEHLNILTSMSTMPKFHKLQRGICLALFSIAGAYSLYNPHVFKTAALALIGVIAYDIVCFFKEKHAPKDYSKDIQDIAEQVKENTQYIKEMKDDVSVAKLASSFRKG
jgi:hypothetical protein